MKPQARTLKNILQIGIPISLQDGFIQISFIIITIIANQRGLNDAAAVGIVEKIISFVFLVPSSMLSCVSAISAQNIGAGKDDRAYKTLQYATMIAVSFGLVVAVCMQFISNPVVGIFTNDVFVIKMGSQYIRSYIWDCMIAGIHFSFSGYFCAYGKSGISFLHNVLSIVLIRIPGAFLASKYFANTLYPMGFAAPCGSLLSVIICISALYYFKNIKKEILKKLGVIVMTFVIIFLIFIVLTPRLELIKDNSSVLAHEQMLYVIRHPINYLITFFYTLIHTRQFLIATTIGTFGLIDTNLYCVFLGAYLFILTLIGISEISLNDRRINLIKRLVIFVSVSAPIFGCFLAMYIYWTSTREGFGVGASEITGVQGRYFIPVMPAIFLFFTNQILQRNDKIKKRMKLLVDNSELVVIVMLCMSAIALLLRFWC